MPFVKAYLIFNSHQIENRFTIHNATRYNFELHDAVMLGEWWWWSQWEIVPKENEKRVNYRTITLNKRETKGNTAKHCSHNTSCKSCDSVASCLQQYGHADTLVNRACKSKSCLYGAGAGAIRDLQARFRCHWCWWNWRTGRHTLVLWLETWGKVLSMG